MARPLAEKKRIELAFDVGPGLEQVVQDQTEGAADPRQSPLECR